MNKRPLAAQFINLAFALWMISGLPVTPLSIEGQHPDLHFPTRRRVIIQIQFRCVWDGWS